jgi:uncharacterized RDD family membrane protein YckC
MEPIDAVPRTDLAGVPRRLVAGCLDFVIWSISMLVAAIVATVAAGGSLHLEDMAFLAFFGGLTVLWELGWTRIGGKPGQRIAGFQVTGLDGSRLPASRALARAVVKLGMLGFPVLLLFSLAAVARTPRCQALHDLVAGSVCVEPAGIARLRSPQAQVPLPVPPPHAPTASSPVHVDEPDPHRGPFL